MTSEVTPALPSLLRFNPYPDPRPPRPERNAAKAGGNGAIGQTRMKERRGEGGKQTDFARR